MRPDPFSSSSPLGVSEPVERGALASSAGLLPSLSVVLPAHDEVEAIARTVRDALAIARVCAPAIEVIVVDDGSRDGTADVLRHLCGDDDGLRVVTHEHNRGYGAALRSGFDAARYDWVFYTDADGQFVLEELPLLIAGLGRADVVSGVRVDRQDPMLRIALGKLWTFATNLSFGLSVSDVNCAFKLYPRALFDLAELRSEGALVDAEVLAEAQRLGYRIGEVPITHRPRTTGRASGVRASVAGLALVELARAWWRRARWAGQAPGRPSRAGARQRLHVESPGTPRP